MTDEKRSRLHPRAWWSLPCTFEDDGREVRAHLGNISAEGAFVVSTARPEAGRRIELRVQPTDTERVRIWVEVQWVTAEDTHPDAAGFGVRVCEGRERWLQLLPDDIDVYDEG